MTTIGTPTKTRLALAAVALFCAGPALADTCDQIRHDQLKYSECMRNDPSRNRPSTPSTYQHVPEPDVAPSEDSFLRERRLKREAAEAEQQRRAQAIREQEQVRRMREHAEETKAFEAKRAANLARARRIRAAQVAAIDALAARLTDPKYDTPDTYDAILTAAVPEADLMFKWAKQARERFPNEFAFRYWVVMRSTCFDVSTVATFDPGFSASRPCLPEQKAAIQELPAAARQGDLPNRILNCAYLHFGFGTMEDTWGAGYLSEGKGTRNRWTETIELERKYTDTLQACEKDLGAALPDVKEGLFKIMWNLGRTRKNSLESFTASFIWLWRSQAVWGGRTSLEALRDPRTATQAIEKTYALFTRRLNGE